MDIRKKDIRYFNVAKEVANMSDFCKHKIGCVVVYKKNIISIGYNSNKTHPIQKDYNIFRFTDDKFPHKLHAETMALANLISIGNKIDFSDIKLYIYRSRKDIGVGMARPCKSCMALIKEMGIKNIYYTTDGGSCYEKL